MQAYNLKNLNIREILDRVKDYSGVRFDTDLGDILKVDRMRPGKWVSKGTVPYDTLIEWAGNNKVSLNWLFANHGPETVSELNEYLIAEESPSYKSNGDADYALFNQVAKVVRDLIKEAGIKIKNDDDEEKLDHLIYYSYNQVKKQSGKINKNEIAGLVQLAL